MSPRLRSHFLLSFAGKSLFLLSTALSEPSYAQQELPRILVIDSPLDAPSVDEDSFLPTLLSSDEEQKLELPHKLLLGNDALTQGFYSDQNPLYFGIINLNDSWAPNRERTQSQTPLLHLSQSPLDHGATAPLKNRLLNERSENYFLGKLHWPLQSFLYGEFFDREKQSIRAISFHQAHAGSEASSLSGNKEIDDLWKLSYLHDKRMGASFHSSFFFHFEQQEFDSGGGSGADDPNAFTQSLGGLGFAEWKLSAQSRAQLAYKYQRRSSENKADALRSFEFKEIYESHSLPLAFDFTQILSEKVQVTWGLNLSAESGNASEEVAGSSPLKSVGNSLSNILLSSKISFHHSRLRPSLLGAVDSYSWKSQSLTLPRAELTLVWDFSDQQSLNFELKRVNQAPSFYQLYSRYGALSLVPEQDQSAQLSWFARSDNLSSLRLSLFLREISSLLDFNPSTERYINLNSAKSFGGDVKADFGIYQNLSAQFHYQFLKTRDAASKLSLIRRPEHNLTSQMTWTVNLISRVFAKVTYLGERDDLDPQSFARIKLKSFSTLDLGYLRRLKDSAQIQLKLNNVLNCRAEEISGYRSKERNIELSYQKSFL